MNYVEPQDLLLENPIIASVKNKSDLEACLNSSVSLVFLLFGNLLEIVSLVDQIKARGKIVIIPIDLVEGLSSHDAAVDYIKECTKADGIVSTKASLLRYAKSLGLLTVQRFFMLDSRALENIIRQIDSSYTDIIEVIPGGLPKVLKKVAGASNKPIIAGGYILDRDDIMDALKAGATAVTTSNVALWNM